MTNVSGPVSQNRLLTIRILLKRIIRSEVLIASLILIGAIAFFYRDVVFGGHTFLIEGATDFGNGLPNLYSKPYHYNGPGQPFVWDFIAISDEMEPWDRLVAIDYKSDQLPLWNPHEGLGVPLPANGNTGVFDPIHALLYLAPLTEWPIAMDFHLLFRYFLAGLFSFLLMRSLGIGFVGALVAAFLFIFSPIIVFQGNISIVRVDTLLPLLLYSYRRLVLKKSFGSFVLVTVAIFLMTVADFHESLLIEEGLGALWYIFHIFIEGRHQNNRPVFFVQLAVLGACATIAGLALASFDLLPFLQYLHAGDTVHGAASALYEPIGRRYNIFAYIAPIEVQIQTRLSTLTLVSVVFGLATIILNRSQVIVRTLVPYFLFFITFAVCAIFVSYRLPIFEIVTRLPLLNLVYFNHFTQAPVHLCFACAAGVGVEFLLSMQRKLKILNALIAVCIVSILMLISALIINRYESILPQQLIVFAVGVGLFLIIFAISAWMASGGKVGRPFASILLLGIALLEPLMFNSTLNERPLRRDPYTVAPYVSFLKNIDTSFRIIGLNGILRPNIASAYSLDDIGYEDDINLAAWNTFRRRFLSPVDYAKLTPGLRLNDFTRFNTEFTPPLFNHAMDMLNVQYVLSTDPTPPISTYGDTAQFSEVYNSAHVFVYRNNNAFPRAYIVHRAEIVTGEQAIFDRFAAKDYDPSRAVILDESPPTEFMSSLPTDSSPYQPATVTAENVNDTTIQASLDTPGFLVLSELAYPGWEATVDGQPAKIYTAYGFMRALALPAGSHIIVFNYRPTLFFVGLGIALITLLALIIAGTTLRLRRKRTIHVD